MCKLLCLMLVLLTGCSNNWNKTISDENDEIGVDEGLLSVEITIPSDFLKGQTQEVLDVIAKENGYEFTKCEI